MAGFGFEELMTKAREGKRPVGSPSTPAQAPKPAVEIEPPTTKRDRPPAQDKAAETEPPHKKLKSGKESSKRHSSHLDLERIDDSDFERLKADPLLFAGEIARAGSRLLAKMKQGEEERTAGMLLSAKNLWLEGDNLDKTDKLTRAYEHISELRQQLEAAKKRASEAEDALQPTNEALKKTQESLKSVEKERDTAVTNLSKAEEDLRLERSKVGELDGKLVASDKRAEVAETNWYRLEGDFDRLVQSTVTLCHERFDEAIRQVRYVYPNYVINEEIIKSDHTVVAGRIVIPAQKDSSGRVVQEEKIVYERPA